MNETVKHDFKTKKDQIVPQLLYLGTSSLWDENQLLAFVRWCFQSHKRDKVYLITPKLDFLKKKKSKVKIIFECHSAVSLQWE